MESCIFVKFIFLQIDLFITNTLRHLLKFVFVELGTNPSLAHARHILYQEVLPLALVLWI